MNKFFKSTVLSLLISCSFNLSSYAYSDNQLRQSIDDYLYLEPNLKKSVIGVKIRDLKTGEDIYSLNSDKLFVPASNTKVLTTLIALEKLGKDYKFKTTVTTDGEVKNNTLNGNLYIHFAGDPTFKHDDIDKLFNQIKNQGIKTINGNIVIDRSVFDDVLYGPGWMWDDMDSCDSSPIDSLYIDRNCVNAKISLIDKKINIESDNTVNFNTNDLKISDKENIQTKLTDNTLKLSGEIKDNTSIEQSISNPQKYIESYLLKYIPNNFNFKGKVLFDKEKEKGKTIAVKESESLSEILKYFNKESHNLTGELITKTVGTTESLPGSTRKGVTVLKNYLQDKFKYNDFRIVDGSGLSRYNLFSPDLMVDVLSYIYKTPEFKPVVLDAFPVGGKEGTLKNRLQNMKKYQVIAKSGSMTGVNCLSGYLINDNQAYAFSIMINNSNLGGKDLRDIQDKILYML